MSHFNYEICERFAPIFLRRTHVKEMSDWYFVLIPSPYIKNNVYNLGWFQKQDLKFTDVK
ncbi:hypothetical protein MAL05_14715 [Leptospira noguchii]|nr:hypothetical protein [Leptospira noguchii]UOG41075.1 hypothetical protein MAL05_14715 [Leptospira noguchii]UOG60027.1 hypothetical protein MAL07_14930 [Leptospira noguchii]